MSSDLGLGARPRILFYSHGSSPGHDQMMLSLASEAARRHPDAAVLLISGSPTSGCFKRPPNLELVKIPSKDTESRLVNLLPAPGSGFTTRGLWAMRESLIHETVRSFDPHLLVGDNLPGGMLGELERAVRTVAAASPKAGMVIILTDVPSDSDALRSSWNTTDRDSVASLYNRTIVLGSPDVFDPIRECGFPPAAARSTHFCGYLRPARGNISVERIRARLGVNQPLVVVSAGGGEPGAPVIDSYLQMLERNPLTTSALTSLIVSGPDLPENERSQFAERAAAIPGVIMVDVLDDLTDHLAAADVVVTRGGYYAVASAVGLGKRAIVIPHDDPLGRQRIRAERFADLGLVRCILPSELTPELLGKTIFEELQADISPPELLDFNGLDCAADIIDGLIDERVPLWPARALGSARTVPSRLSTSSTPIAGKRRRIATAWDNTRFFVDSANLIESEIVNRRGFEIELQKEIASLVFPGDNVIDCGANIGIHACPLARRVGPDGLVIAVEPVPFLADRLEDNRLLNDLDNLVVVREAVSSSSGRRTLNAPTTATWNQGAGTFHYSEQSEPAVQIEVEIVTIDELVQRFELTGLRLLKMDIEGHEMEALRGAREVLSSFRPHIFFEFHPAAWKIAGWKLAHAIRLLKTELGYDIYPIGPEINGIQNMGARPPDPV